MLSNIEPIGNLGSLFRLRGRTYVILTTAYNCAQIKLTVPRDGCSLWEMPFNISAGDSHDQEQDSEQDTRLSR